MRIGPLFGAFVFVCAAASGPSPTGNEAHAAGPPAAATAQTATLRVARAREALQASLASLIAAPSRTRLAQVHRAMQEIQAGLDVYFHGAVPASAGARAAMAELRVEVGRLLGGAEPTLVVSDDVLRFQPALHRRLAAVAVQVGEFRHAIEHLRAAQVVDGSRPEDLEALVAAHRSAGDLPGAAAVEAELRTLRGAAATPVGHP